MRWVLPTLVLVALSACDPPPTSSTPAPVPAIAKPKDTLAGKYRLTKPGRKTVAKWGKRFKKDKALLYLERLEVYTTAGGDLAVSPTGIDKGPYILRAAGTRTWIYPLKKGWKVHVKHRRARSGHRLRAWVGPVSVTYVRE